MYPTKQAKSQGNSGKEPKEPSVGGQYNSVSNLAVKFSSC